MFSRHDIGDAHRDRIRGLLPGRAGGRGGVAAGNRRVIGAIRSPAKAGVAWADRPAYFGQPNGLWQRHDRWCQEGVGARAAAALRDDTERLGVDSTRVRGALAAAGAGKKRAGPAARALGRSRGGFGTTVHAAVTPLGHPVALEVTGAEAADGPHPPGLSAGVEAAAGLADKGTTRPPTAGPSAGGGGAVRPAAEEPHAADRPRPAPGPRAERGRAVLRRAKQSRRVATRYDERAANFRGFARVASIGMMLA